MDGEKADDGSLLASLTAKQREVMDLLIEHKTSKEIARILAISPHTVDQRIQIAKDKLGAVNRNEAAMIYRRLIETYGRATYQNSHIPSSARLPENPGGTQAGLSSMLHRRRPQPARPIVSEADISVVPELFEGRYGTLIRLGAIGALAVFLVILVLGGLAILSQLSELLAG